MKSMMVAVYSHFKTFIIGKPDMKQLESFFSIPAENSLYLGFNAISDSETINQRVIRVIISKVSP
jgi:hypothetical protein